MAKVIDISSKIKREPIFIHIAEGFDAKVNDGKNTVFEIMSIWDNDDINEIEKLEKTLKLALGNDAKKKIDALDLSLEGYKTIAMAVMATISGQELEEFEERFRNA